MRRIGAAVAVTPQTLRFTIAWYNGFMKADSLTISVIIPLRNGARFIAQALDSVFAQIVSPAEVIVVDYGSHDEGPSIAERYVRSHNLILLHKPDGVQSAARNCGIRHSRGSLIAFLDQDDTWYPDHLSDFRRRFSQDGLTSLGWVYSNVDEITKDNGLRRRAALSLLPGVHPKTQLDQCLGQDTLVLPSASMISRAAFDTVGGFDEALSGYETEDLFVRFFLAGYRNTYIRKSLGQWRIYPPSHSDTRQVARSRMAYARKLLRCFPDEPALSCFYSRDLIVPRFLPQLVNESRIALRMSDVEWAELCLEEIALLESYLPPARRSPAVARDLLISAVIPLYNGGAFIREALESIFSQALVPDEIIVVDDGSTDDGPDIVSELAERHPIRLLRKQNGGQSSARNFGVDHAHGDLIAFLDQDDAWYPNHLKELIKPFYEARAVELGWTYSNLDEVNEAGEMVARGVLDPFSSAHPKRDLMGCLKEDMFVLPSASLVSRKAFRSVGGFDERLSGYEDDDLFLRIFLAGFDNAYISDPLSRWRIFQASSSYSQSMAASRMTYARKLISRFPNDPDTSRFYVRNLIAPRFFKLLMTELRKATFKCKTDEQIKALADLRFMSGMLRTSYRIPVRFVLLPVLHIAPMRRLVMHHRVSLYRILRLIF